MEPDHIYHRILLVEDDPRLAALIMEYLQQHGLQVEVEARGDRAVERVATLQPDLVLLDVMLPGLDGFEVCRQARASYAGPIVMLTARGQDMDQVAGLELGADDYILKPVQPRLLLAKLRAHLRRAKPRAGAALGAEALDFGRLRIVPYSRDVWLDGAPLKLTTQEYDLLHVLASHAGQVLSRDDLLRALTGKDYDGLDRSVDIRISRLRKLLERHPDNPTGIKTVRGSGYLFTTQGWQR